MKRFGIYVLLCSLVLTSILGCNKSSRDLSGKWKAVQLENPTLDSFFNESKIYIDSMGSNNNDATNLELYGTTNVDSLRALMREKLKASMDAQENAVNNAYFDLRKDSMAYIEFVGAKDTSIWYLENDSTLVFIEQIGQDKGMATKMNIAAFNEHELVLLLQKESSISKVTFQKISK